MIPWIKSGRNNPEHMRKWKRKIIISRKLKLKKVILKMMDRYITQKIFLWDGMESKNFSFKTFFILNIIRPIPYWLYKLHGLGIEYKCEICGNYSYWGRRAFERHFQEWRHAYGMKCLRIPNTIHFKEITSINDALACNLNKN